MNKHENIKIMDEFERLWNYETKQEIKSFVSKAVEEAYKKGFIDGGIQQSHDNEILVNTILNTKRKELRDTLDKYYACGGMTCEDKLIADIEKLTGTQ